MHLLVKLYRSDGKILAGFYPPEHWGNRRNPVEIGFSMNYNRSEGMRLLVRKASSDTNWWSAYAIASDRRERSEPWMPIQNFAYATNEESEV